MQYMKYQRSGPYISQEEYFWIHFPV